MCSSVYKDKSSKEADLVFVSKREKCFFGHIMSSDEIEAFCENPSIAIEFSLSYTRKSVHNSSISRKMKM